MTSRTISITTFLIAYFWAIIPVFPKSDGEKSIIQPEPSGIEIVGLIYHRFGEINYPTTNISPGLFEEHLRYLKDHNIQCITFSEAVKLLREGKIKGRFCVLTIDDAFKSFYTTGFPLLKKYGLKATLFLNTSTIGGGDYMTTGEVQEVIRSGIEIGNHTHNHDYFLNFDDREMEDLFVEDIKKANGILMEKFHLIPKIFAFPYGEYNHEMQQVLKDLGFIGAAAQHSGVMSEYADLFALPRFPMTDHYGNMDLFMQKINARPMPVKYVTLKNTLSNINPPILKIEIKEDKVDLSRLQCFIQGGECIIKKSGDHQSSLEIISDTELFNRRHLYTLTAPGKEGGEWFWFSHLWIFPGVK